jgi:hypothetical protein
MRTGSLVTYKCYKNIKKINDIGVVLEIQQNLILKESIGFEYEDLLRIHWFTDRCSGGVPSFRTDCYQRRWYLSKGIYIIDREMIYGNI